MPYICLKISTANEHLILNTTPTKMSQIKIYAYQFLGINNNQTAFIRFKNQPTTQMVVNTNPAPGYSNISSTAFPLLIVNNQIPFIYNDGLSITEGDITWDSSIGLDIEITDFNNVPLVFSSTSKLILILQFTARSPFDTVNNPPQNFIEREKAKETVTRNAYPLPNFYKDGFGYI